MYQLKQEKNVQKELRIQNFILMIISLSLIWAGGYYEYTSAVLGGVMSLMLVYIIVKFKASKNICLNPGLLFSGINLIFYIISCFYAVDSGMAFTGVVKKSTAFIFAVLILFIDETQRKKLVHLLPHLASFVCILGAAGVGISKISSLVSGLKGFSDVLNDFIVKNGCFSGTFGYANTFALVMLMGIIVAFLKLNKSDIINSAEIVVMFAGLWFSGSCFTLVLFGFTVILLLLHINSNKIRAAVLGIIFFIGVIFGILFRSAGIIGRIFSDNLSTLYGRLLYWQDALLLIKKYPFGMGYLGYHYKQPQIQTGVYTVRYVHNDILQIALDIGLLPMCMIIAVIVLALLNKERDYIERILIFTIFAHCIFEFDLEYTVVVFILVLLLSCSNEKFYERFSVSTIILKYNAIAFGLVCIYMVLPLSFYAAGNNGAALKTYPAYTDAAIAKLSKTQDMDEREKIAEQILKQNDTVSTAYSALAQEACQEEDIDRLVIYENKAIERNKFDKKQYIEYLSLLNDMLGSETVVKSDKLTNMVIDKMKEVPEIIEKNEGTVSRLGKKINNKVDIELDEEMLKSFLRRKS